MQQKHNMSEMTAPRSRHFFLILDLVFPVLLLIGFTILFRSTSLDLQIQSHYFKSSAGWYLKDLPVFQILYRFGNLPALALSVWALLILGLGYRTRKYVKWRKIGYFLIFTMILAPGLIINTALKDQWGRPRPRNVLEYGGKYHYEKLLTIDPTSPGKSFPCGHASMGFYLFVPWFLLRKKCPKSAVLVLFTGVIAGLAIGWARIAQGGHFASDVVWAGMLVYITAAVLFRVLKMHSSVWYYPAPSDIPRQHKAVVQFAFGILIVMFILGVMLATPYEKEQKFASRYSPADSVQFILQTQNIDKGDVTILPGKEITFANATNAFGFPGSKISARYQEKLSGKRLEGKYTQEIKGFFTEQDIKTRINYPVTDSLQYKLIMTKGNVQMTIPEEFVYLDLEIEILKGNLVLDIPSTFKPRVKLYGNVNLIDRTGFKEKDGIYINPAFKLTIKVTEGEVILK